MPYTKLTDFSAKDALISGNPSKLVRGTEIDAELNAISAAIALNAPIASPTFTGTTTTVAITATGDITQSTSGARHTFSTATGNGGIQNNATTSYIFTYGGSHATKASHTDIVGAVVNVTGSSGINLLSSTAVTGNLTATGSVHSVGSASTAADIDFSLSENNYYSRLHFKHAGTAHSTIFGYYASGLYFATAVGYSHYHLVNSVTVTTINAAGLAVTGTLSATGLATIYGVSGGSPNLTLLGPSGDNNWGGVLRLYSNNGTTVRGVINASTSGIIISPDGGTTSATISTTGLAVTGTVKATTGMAVGGAAAGTGGIAFPATAVAVADANTLDDYEEGTWTPSIGGTATYTTQYGKYTKIGDTVYVQCKLIVNVIGTGSAGVISGLPFAASGTGSLLAISVGYFSSLAVAPVSIAGAISATSATIQGSTVANASVTSPLNALGSAARFEFTATYNI